jgi:hypothetical protein
VPGYFAGDPRQVTLAEHYQLQRPHFRRWLGTRTSWDAATGELVENYTVERNVEEVGTECEGALKVGTPDPIRSIVSCLTSSVLREISRELNGHLARLTRHRRVRRGVRQIARAETRKELRSIKCLRNHQVSGCSNRRRFQESVSRPSGWGLRQY